MEPPRRRQDDGGRGEQLAQGPHSRRPRVGRPLISPPSRLLS
ncbi:conserved domain protein [Actinomyces sp. oral taxon 170 str. F0386]|nr:conserved domain protein [Actinomyces sp. oral taxon 170 str. F0386]